MRSRKYSRKRVWGLWLGKVGSGEHHYRKVLNRSERGELIAEAAESNLFAILQTRRFRPFQALLHHICIEHAVLLQIVGDGVLG
jgi:hypothetical protein